MEESGMGGGEIESSEAIIKDDKPMTVVEDAPPSYVKIIEEITKCQILSTTNTPRIQETLVQANEKITPFSQTQTGHTAKTMMEIEIQKAEIKRQQFIKEKELTEEIFRAKERILEAEMKLALSKLDGQCDFSLGLENICAPGSPDNRVNAYSNASAPLEIYLDPTLTQSPTNNMPSEISQNFGAVGLDQLALMESVKITQASCSGANETHHVLTPDGSVLLRADVTLGWIEQEWSRKVHRPVHKGTFFDSQNQVVVKFHPFKFRKMEVQVGKEKPCILKLKSTFIKPVMSVKDMFNNVLLKIKGHGISGNTAVFTIETVAKLRIGFINKDLDETAQNVGSSSIQFPRDLDISCKAAIIICSFFIVSRAQAQMRDRRMEQALMPKLPQISIEE